MENSKENDITDETINIIKEIIIQDEASLFLRQSLLEDDCLSRL